MKFDLTITLSIIIIFVTAISPIIVTILNNRHQLKIKNLEFSLSLKQKAIEDFIEATMNCVGDYKTKVQFYKCLNKIAIYSDIESSKLLGKIKSLVEQEQINIKELNSALLDFILFLNKTVPKVPKEQESTLNK